MKPITFDLFARGLMAVAAAALLLWVVGHISAVLLPFFLGWLIAYILYPLVCFLQRRMGIRARVPAILIAMALVIGAVAGLLWLMIPSIISQFERLGELVISYVHETTNIHNIPEALREWIGANQENITRFFRSGQAGEWIRKATPQLISLVTKTANLIINIIASLLTLMYAFFILLDYEKLGDGFVRIFPKRQRTKVRLMMDDVEHALNSYIRGQGTIALCIGILFCIGLTIIGFPMAIGMGILIGVLSLIPYLHGLALIPMVLLSLLKAVDTGQNFWAILGSALLVFAIIQLITDMILTPRIMGKAMNLNPAILLLSLSVWGSLLGFVGLILALPLTTLIIAYYQRYITKDTNPETVEEKTDGDGKDGEPDLDKV